MSDPKKWLRSDNRFTEVHTPYTIRAKELMDIYNGLRLKNLSIDERLDILLNTKWTVKSKECNLTKEIVELIDREADMLNRGRPESSLEGMLLCDPDGIRLGWRKLGFIFSLRFQF